MTYKKVYTHLDVIFLLPPKRHKMSIFRCKFYNKYSNITILILLHVLSLCSFMK